MNNYIPKIKGVTFLHKNRLIYKNNYKMKKLSLILLIFVFSNCGQRTAGLNNEIDTSKVDTIQKCEYFYYYPGGYKSYLHKGNCSNTIHYKKIEITYDTVYCSR